MYYSHEPMQLISNCTTQDKSEQHLGQPRFLVFGDQLSMSVGVIFQGDGFWLWGGRLGLTLPSLLAWAWFSDSVLTGESESTGCGDAANGFEDFNLREVKNWGGRTFETLCDGVSWASKVVLGSKRVLSVRVFTASSIAVSAPCCLIRFISSASAWSLASITRALERTRRWRLRSASSSCFFFWLSDKRERK